MGRKIILMFLIISAPGCTDFKLHVKKEAMGIKPLTILIAPFEIRNMNYDPFVCDEFRDVLKFNFFQRGYNTIILSKSDKTLINESQWAAKICSDNSGDMLIKGFISERESGFLADSEIESIISFTVYGNNGNVISEGFYHDDESVGNDKVRRNAADKFVSELLEEMEQD